MNPYQSFWIAFLKKIFLALGNLFLFYPIVQIFIPLNHFEKAEPLQLFVLSVSLFALLIPFWYLCLPLQLAAALYVYQQYFPLSETGWSWLQIQYEQLARSLEQFLQGDLAIFPTNVGLVLMLVLIVFATYTLIQHFQPTYVILICLVYLMILHIFTPFDFFHQVVQTVGVSILLIGISQVSVEKGWRRALFSFLVVSIAGFVFTRAALWGTENLVPQQQWVENQARGVQQKLEEKGFFNWVDYYSSGGGLQRMGYGENDSQLGGPLQQNFDQVFSASDSQPHYWRISTKERYTGRGWEQQENAFSLPLETAFPEPASEETTVEVEIVRAPDFPYFPYTYQTYSMAVSSENAYMEIPSMKVIGENANTASEPYLLTIADHDIDFASLEEADFSEENLEGAEVYLELPENISERLRELAASITTDQDTVYDQVRAIETYLRSEAGLRYSLREAAYLPEEKEYVDHFLFESQVGYCDNFSTAMVVLCRIMGIPARWAKGFNSGTPVMEEDGGRHYEITNANAHSWPEVYFPEYGWLPFEPTPAFQQPLTNPANTPDGDAAEPGNEFPLDENVPEANEAESVPPAADQEEEEAPSSSESSAPADQEENTETPRPTDFWKNTSALLFIAAVWAAFLFRRQLYPRLLRLFLQLPSLSLLLKCRLITALFQMNVAKEPGETLRHYFGKIIRKLPMHKKAITDYIQLNETLLYAPKKEAAIDSEKAQRLLLQMITVYQDLNLLKRKTSF